MKINSQTKISAIIKHNKEAIDAIASVNPHFNKLRNPILRKVVAPRVTIEDAARIGKCSIAEIMSKLSSIGFEIEEESVITEKAETSDFNENISAQMKAGKIRVLDVRPQLKAGSDPFNLIMDELKLVPEGFVLEVVNSFEPTPLIKILNNKGYESSVKTMGETIHTYFLKASIPAEEKIKNKSAAKISLVEMEIKKEKFKNKLLEVDVRDMEMPLPMVTILSELENLKEGHALFVHHKKVPQYLLPEIEERDFIIWIAEVEEGNVKLLIHK